jgi:hypothetical protein
MLRERSKDLQLAMWLTEANIKQQGFPGLGYGLHVARELLVRYWDNGLYPSVENGPEDRAGPFEWLNEKLVDSIKAIPITVRADQGQNYSFIDLEDARRTGSEASCRTVEGEPDAKKKKAYEDALAEGHISMEMFERAIEESKRTDHEKLSADFEQSYEEFQALEKVIDEKFGDAAPNLSGCRAALREMRQAVSSILEKKRKQEPDPSPLPSPETTAGHLSETGDSVTVRFPLSLSNPPGTHQGSGGSWQEAEMLIRSGQVDKGLAEMTRLAAIETSGRNRFQRKLLLAEACLASKRERLARSILEELAEQIDKLNLETWEASELIGSVWIKLYGLYTKGEGGSSDSDRAGKLYERLCRLDPWQALACGE